MPVMSLSVLGTFVLLALVGGGMYGCPQYNVWQQELAGKAELGRAKQNRQIEISRAKAKNEAAVFEAEAEVARAKGVAEANKIIAHQLGGGEAYLRYRYILMLEETGGKGRETIYVPTEGGLPILEAGKRGGR